MQVLKVSFGVYCLVTISVTGIHLFGEYQNTQEDIYQNLKTFQGTLGKGLALALWDVNDDQIAGMMDGMVAHPNVIGVKIEAASGEVKALGGFLDDQEQPRFIDPRLRSLTVLDENLFRGLFWYSFPLSYQDEYNNLTDQVGIVTIYSNGEVVLEMVKPRVYFILLNAAIKTLALWVIFLWVGRIVLSKPLMKLQEEVSKLALANLQDTEIQIQTHEQNELSMFQDTVNRMARQLAKDRDELKAQERLQVELQESQKRETQQWLHQKEIETKNKELSLTNTQLQTTLTQLEKTQDQLIESEKMASLGGLVAGIAHEVNTPLGVGVTGVSTVANRIRKVKTLYEQGELSEEELTDFFESGKELADQAVRNMLRASELIQSFKQVAVDQSSYEKMRFPLRKYLETTLQSLTPKLKSFNPEIVILCEQEVEIHSYPGAFSQVITNFVTNSLMHGFEGREHGTLTFEIKSESDHQEPSHVMFRYSDDGNGIPEKHLKKIFDPFFTTKRAKGGSGLGLHIIYNIVTHKLGGTIQCESTVGQGTTFTLTLAVEAE